MRQINENEINMIKFLSKMGNIDIDVSKSLQVSVVNKEMGSIRSEHCPSGCIVKPASHFEFLDLDGTPIVATLLLDNEGKFGELDFWKVNDQPMINFPSI